MTRKSASRQGAAPLPYGLAFLLAFWLCLPYPAPAAGVGQGRRPLPGTAPASVTATKKAPSPVTHYFGVYLQEAKVGSLVVSRDEKAATVDGRPAVRVESTMSLALPILGKPARITSLTRTWSDRTSGAPLAQESVVDSAGRSTRVSTTYSAAGLTYRAVIQGEEQKGTLKLAPGEKFLVAPGDSADPVAEPRVGDRLTGKVFLTDTLQLIDSELEVVAREQIPVEGKPVPAYKVLDKNPAGPSTLYVDAEGDLLRIDGPLPGMQMRRAAKAVALAEPKPGAKAPDLALAVGIRPEGAPLRDPRRLRTARYRVSGITTELPPSDSVQAATFAPGSKPEERTATVTVTTRPLPPSSGVAAFARPEDAPAALRPFLQSTVYVPAADPEFRDLAATILNGETDTARAAKRLAGYVHRTIQPDAGIAALRTARDIKKEPRGVCRDYTTLFTALARAAGIPTRQCVGIAYADGAFLYHAWPEVWVGDDRWIALEPTWGEPFADATHIKLAQGEITDLYRVTADMGRYQITVLEATE